MNNLNEINKIIEDYILSIKTGVYSYKELLNDKEISDDKDKQRSFLAIKKLLDENTLQMYVRNKVCDLKKNDKIRGGNGKVLVLNQKDKILFNKFKNIYLKYTIDNKIYGNENMCYDLDIIFFANKGNAILPWEKIYIRNSFLKEKHFIDIKNIIDYYHGTFIFIDDDSSLDYSIKEYLSKKIIDKTDLNTFKLFLDKNSIDLYTVLKKYINRLNNKEILKFMKNIKIMENYLEQ